MSRVRALLASFLVASTVAGVAAQTPRVTETEPPPAPATPPSTEADLDRIRRGLAKPPSPLSESLSRPDAVATFRVSVTQKPFDLAAFWGEPDNLVGAYVVPSGGPWHHEFKQMVTPDMFKGFANLGNAERLQLMASSGAFAAAMALLQTGVRAVRDAAYERQRQRAREQVQQELEEFLKQHALPPPK